MQTGETTTRVELCVESLHPTGTASRQETVIAELRALETAGRIDEVDVVVQGDRIGFATRAAGTDAGRRVRERVDACLAWAEAADRSLRPCLTARTVRNAITGEAYTVLDLPAMLLVEYENGEVSHVTPSSDGTVVETVDDRLETLTGGATDPRAIAAGTPGDDREAEASLPEELLPADEVGGSGTPGDPSRTDPGSRSPERTPHDT